MNKIKLSTVSKSTDTHTIKFKDVPDLVATIVVETVNGVSSVSSSNFKYKNAYAYYIPKDAVDNYVMSFDLVYSSNFYNSYVIPNICEYTVDDISNIDLNDLYVFNGHTLINVVSNKVASKWFVLSYDNSILNITKLKDFIQSNESFITKSYALNYYSDVCVMSMDSLKSDHLVYCGGSVLFDVRTASDEIIQQFLEMNV